MKISTRARDKHYTARLQRATQMVTLLKENVRECLHIIDQCNMEFMTRSQTHSSVWYALFLNTQCCEYEDRIAICKHSSAIQMLLDEQLQHLKKLLPSIEQLFYHELYKDGFATQLRLNERVESITNQMEPSTNQMF